MDLQVLKLLAGIGIATVLPILAVVATVAAVKSRDMKRRRAVALGAVSFLLTFFHPVVQEGFNWLYLEPKLERARALFGHSIDELIAELGEPSSVVPEHLASPGSYAYLLYRPSAWTPLATRELIVPLSNDGQTVSVYSHFAD